MTDRIELAGLKVARQLADFVSKEALPGTGVDEKAFWEAFSSIVDALTPKNRALLAKRNELQEKIDAWHRANGAPSDLAVYKDFLKEIGYLLDEGPDFKVTTENVDPEIAVVAGPQLVVPVMNARYALNAANARWGSLYDALYGTDAISEADGAAKGNDYNPKRGAKVISWAKSFLDEAAPLDGANWRTPGGFRSTMDASSLHSTADGRQGLKRPEQFAGYLENTASPSQFLLENNGLHIEVLIDPASDDRQKRSRAHLGCLAGIRSDDDPGLRGFRRRRRRRGQGRRLPQLARPDERRPGGGGFEGRQDLCPQAQSRSRLYCARWRQADLARPLADAGA